jgi:hypothetical protein
MAKLQFFATMRPRSGRLECLWGECPEKAPTPSKKPNGVVRKFFFTDQVHADSPSGTGDVKNARVARCAHFANKRRKSMDVRKPRQSAAIKILLDCQR